MAQPTDQSASHGGQIYLQPGFQGMYGGGTGVYSGYQEVQDDGMDLNREYDVRQHVPMNEDSEYEL